MKGAIHGAKPKKNPFAPEWNYYLMEHQINDVDFKVISKFLQKKKKDVLKLPAYGCINGHASLLPHWRGASPIQYAIWNGDPETGITVMQMAAGLDTGPSESRAGARPRAFPKGLKLDGFLIRFSQTSFLQSTLLWIVFSGCQAQQNNY